MLSYVDAPSSGDVETSLLVELLRDALMFDAAGVDTAGAEGAEGAEGAAATSLVASLAAATDAIRSQGDAEVRLGAAELRAVLASAVGAAKKIWGVEALENRERRLRRELASIARKARDGALGAGARTSPPRWRTSSLRTKTKGGGSGKEDRGRSEEGSPPSGEHPSERSERSEGVSPRPSSPRRRVARWTSRERRTSPRTRAASASTPSSPFRLRLRVRLRVGTRSIERNRRGARDAPSRGGDARSARAPTSTSSAASRARSCSTPSRFATGNPPS